MSQDERIQELLTRMEKNSRKQLFHSRIQCVFSIIAGVCCFLLLVNVIRIIPQITGLAQQADLVMQNLEIVTEELTKLDLSKMVNNINSLVSTSQSGVEDAMKQISQIDVNTLNQAIADLSDVVKPLANLVNRFR